MTTVRDLLEKKGKEVWSVAPTTPLKEALVLMAEKKVGALVVVEEDKLVGIFSERDLARSVAHSDDFSTRAPIRDLMISPVYFVSPEQTVEECMTVMTVKRFRHLPVMEDNQLVGVISIGDVVKSVIAEKDSAIQDLEHFLWVNMI